MSRWTTANEVNKDADAFTKIIFCLFGLYVWEIFQTSNFEWSFITNKRKFSWPLIFFFLSRYCMLFALVGLIITLTITTPIDCTALYIFDSVSGNLAILAASTSLMIRTIALWKRDRTVTAILCFFCLGHWAILWRGMFIVHATFSPEAGRCIVTADDHVFLNVTFFATMGFDFLVLCFTVAALFKQKTHSDLWNLLFKDGLVYFCITFFCNALPAIFNVLNLNPIMNIIATIPAATVASIAACRLVMRLHQFTHTADCYVHSAQQMASHSTTRGQMRFNKTKSFAMPRTPEIMVTTDKFVMQDFSPVAYSGSSKRNSSRKVRDLEAAAAYDATTAYSELEYETPEGSPKIPPPSFQNAI